MRWVITREREDSAELVRALRARGVDALCIPAIVRKPLLPWPRELDVDGAALFLTSPYAAQLALAHYPDVATRRVGALSPSTLSALDQAGARVDVAVEGGAARLAEACANAGWTGDVVYPTSDAGLAQAEQAKALATLDAAGCRVHRGAVYTTTPAADLDAELRALGDRWCGAVLYSPSAARAFFPAVTRVGVRVAHYLCVGGSTLDALPLPAALASPVSADDVVARILELDRARHT